jgi:hypothetical protein
MENDATTLSKSMYINTVAKLQESALMTTRVGKMRVALKGLCKHCSPPPLSCVVNSELKQFQTFCFVNLSIVVRVTVHGK